MRSSFIVIALAAACLDCTPQQGAQLEGQALAEAAKIGGCVLSQIVNGGLDDPAAIAAKCGGATIVDVAQATQGWLDQLTTTADAGADDAGNPRSVSPVQARISLVHNRAVAAIDGGAK